MPRERRIVERRAKAWRPLGCGKAMLTTAATRLCKSCRVSGADAAVGAIPSMVARLPARGR